MASWKYAVYDIILLDVDSSSLLEAKCTFLVLKIIYLWNNIHEIVSHSKVGHFVGSNIYTGSVQSELVVLDHFISKRLNDKVFGS